MNLYLQRHAHPVNGHPMDGTRQLDVKGRAQAAEMAAFMVKEVGRVDICITSPFARAMETAEVMADALGCHLADSRMLEPDGTPEKMWEEITRLVQRSTSVLMVGHDPSINTLCCWLMGFPGVQCTFLDNDYSYPPLISPPSKSVGMRFDHGAIAWLIVKGKTGALQWLATPKLVHQDEEEKEVVEAARELAAFFV